MGERKVQLVIMLDFLGLYILLMNNCTNILDISAFWEVSLFAFGKGRKSVLILHTLAETFHSFSLFGYAMEFNK